MTPKNGIRKRKYPLVFATAVAFLSVCTAGVSTFAWFQASAQVQISATSSETTISVTQPTSSDSVKLAKLYYYKDNLSNFALATSFASGTTYYTYSEGVYSRAATQPTSENFGEGTYYVPSGYTGAAPSTSFLNQFAEVVSGQGHTSISNLYPGHKMTFAIDVATSTISEIHLKLEKNQFTPGYSANKVQTTNSDDYSQTYVYMATAINIYTAIQVGSNALSDTPPSVYSSDQFDFRMNTTANDYSLIDNTSGSIKYARLFYTIEFGTGPDTLYTEYSDAAGTAALGTGTPGATRYFKKDTSGDSSCYIGLPFSITRLSLTAVA